MLSERSIDHTKSQYTDKERHLFIPNRCLFNLTNHYLLLQPYRIIFRNDPNSSFENRAESSTELSKQEGITHNDTDIYV